MMYYDYTGRHQAWKMRVLETGKGGGSNVLR